MPREGTAAVDGGDRLEAEDLLADLRSRPTEELAGLFRDLDSLHAATGAHRLLVLAVLDEREVSRDDGTLDTVGWVTWTSRLSRSRARALVETARALPARPRLTTVALEGGLSDEQLDAAVRVATPETDAEWAEAAPGWTAASLRAAARNQRTVTAQEAVERDQQRSVTYRWDEHRGGLRLKGWFPDVDGATVAAALEARAEQLRPAPGESWDPYPQRCADVVVEALSRELDEQSEANRATVVVHVPESAVREGSDAPGTHLDAGAEPVAIANETARRVACDSVIQIEVDDEKGVPIKLGRRTRTVPPHIWRLLKERDRHCRAPGCTRTRGLHAHHVRHWIDGGTTDPDNLMLLCTVHHRMLHEHGWTIRGTPGAHRFIDRDGYAVTPGRPSPLDPAIRERLLVART
jgi:hypothetical protein